MSKKPSRRLAGINEIVEDMTDAERRLLLTQLREWRKDKAEAKEAAKEAKLPKRTEAQVRSCTRQLLAIAQMQEMPIYGFEDESLQYVGAYAYDRQKIGLAGKALSAWVFFIGASKPPQKLRSEQQEELSRALSLAFPTEILAKALTADSL